MGPLYIQNKYYTTKTQKYKTMYQHWLSSGESVTECVYAVI